MSGAIDTRRLAELEETIERGLATFIEVGTALAEVRDSRLYLAEHSTFEDYCRKRWEMSRSYAHRTIDAAKVAALLPNGNAPTNEAQARELVPLAGDEAELVEAWREARSEAEKSGGKLSAKVVRNAVRTRILRAGREAQLDGAKEDLYTKEYVCCDCGEVNVIAGGVRFVVDAGEVVCLACEALRHREAEREREAWWQSLSEAERVARTEAERDREDRRKLEASLQMFGNPDGEGMSIAGYLAQEVAALHEVDAWRHPEMLGHLAAVVAELEDAIGDFRIYVEVQEARVTEAGERDGCEEAA